MNYNHEEAVKTATAIKLMIRTKRRVKEMTSDCNDPCECRMNLNKTLHVLVKLGAEVFNYRPEYYASVVILGDTIKDMVTEMDRTISDKREVIYL